MVHLVIAAHPDDETAGLGGWLAAHARRHRFAICFLTDGAPRDVRYRAPDFRGRLAAYRLARRREASRAAGVYGLRPSQLFFAPFPDQELHRHLRAAAACLSRLAARLQPGRIWAPAYEGGHPDHDSANFLAAAVFGRGAVWEYALYTTLGTQVRFLQPEGRAWRHWRLSAATRQAKRRALACYHSQRMTLAPFDAPCEHVRPLPLHDYSRPGGQGVPVWTLWGWPLAAAEPCAAFQRFLRSVTPRSASPHFQNTEAEIAPVACS